MLRRITARLTSPQEILSQLVIPAKSALGGREPGSRKKFDYVKVSLDSGSRPAKRSLSGMTRTACYDQSYRGKRSSVQSKA